MTQRKVRSALVQWAQNGKGHMFLPHTKISAMLTALVLPIVAHAHNDVHVHVHISEESLPTTVETYINALEQEVHHTCHIIKNNSLTWEQLKQRFKDLLQELKATQPSMSFITWARTFIELVEQSRTFDHGQLAQDIAPLVCEVKSFIDRCGQLDALEIVTRMGNHEASMLKLATYLGEQPKKLSPMQRLREATRITQLIRIALKK